MPITSAGSPSQRFSSQFRLNLLHRAPWLASLIFGAWCAAYISHGPGLQYDEAYSVRGATVLVLGSGPCTALTSIFIRKHCWPLMVAPYVGASKDYLAALLFLLFGATVPAIRLAAALLGMASIWGWTTLLRDRVSPAVGAFAAFVLCINPAFLDQILFDSGNIAMSMGMIGVAAACGNQYLKSRRSSWAFLFGFALGMAVWSRLNFSWLIAGMVTGSLVAFRGTLFRHGKRLLAVACGFLAGLLPLLFFYSRDPSALRNYIGGNKEFHTWAQWSGIVLHRLQLSAEILFYDVEHRAIWSPQPVLGRVVWASGIIGLIAVLWCLFRRGANDAGSRWIRSIAACALFLTLILLTTQLPVADHHLVILLPFVLPCVIALGLGVGKARAAPAVALVGITTYASAAIALQFNAISALSRNRGIGEWSDAIAPVSNALMRAPAAVNASVLDWGLEGSIFFLSGAKLQPREIFWHATAENSGRNLTWQQEVAHGGVFLTNAPQRLFFPAATEGFTKALHASGLPYTVQQFVQRNGSPYALLYRVPPQAN